LKGKRGEKPNKVQKVQVSDTTMLSKGQMFVPKKEKIKQSHA